MSEKIEPALSAEEWRELEEDIAEWAEFSDKPSIEFYERVDRENAPAAIAVANRLLPDSDSRKITREKIALLREHAHYSKHGDAHGRLIRTADDLAAFADVLESYLPTDAR